MNDMIKIRWRSRLCYSKTSPSDRLNAIPIRKSVRRKCSESSGYYSYAIPIASTHHPRLPSSFPPSSRDPPLSLFSAIIASAASRLCGRLLGVRSADELRYLLSADESWKRICVSLSAKSCVDLVIVLFIWHWHRPAPAWLSVWHSCPYAIVAIVGLAASCDFGFNFG